MSESINQYSGNLRYAVDIVFCVDTTASMRPVLEDVKDSAMSFHDRLSTVMAEREKHLTIAGQGYSVPRLR